MLKKIVLSFALACCLGTAVQAQEPKMGGTINAVIQPEPPGLNIAMIQNGPTQMVSGNIFEGLLRYSPKLEPLPGLADSWTISPDGKVYTFKLKPGVTWHDGKPFTSADVLFSIEMLKQTHARARGNLVQVDKVEAPDDLTVVFTLKQPFGPFIGIFEVGSMPMMPKHLYDGTDYKTNPYNNAPDRHRPVHVQGMAEGRVHPSGEEPELPREGQALYRRHLLAGHPRRRRAFGGVRDRQGRRAARRLGREFRRAAPQQAERHLRHRRRLGVLQPAGLAVAQQPLRPDSRT